MSLAKHWAFTWNNYTDNDVDRLSAAFDKGGINYLIFGKEISSTGTPHLQGHVSFEEKRRLAYCKDSIGQAHFSVARVLPKSINYCKKDRDFTEYGTSPVVASNQGRRTDLEAFKTAVDSGVYDAKVLRKTFSDVCAQYPRFVREYVRDNKPLPPIPDHALRDWQSGMVDLLDEVPDPRGIYFVVDTLGNTGKSFFCSYCEKNLLAVQIMKCGKRDDMAFELDDSKLIYIVDVSRAAAPYLCYTLLEDIKDGRVFSPKYESCQKRMSIPHVVVMMNETPDMTKLSKDRYKIVNI